ncbi:ATP-binding protein [Streptomyces sp. NPDC097619]|uniref:ATP-binding protein n=1 Tax=Streptomyces sp. NPDC097619 TaxID=3157228 RepID=UPI003318AA7C
MHSRRRVDIVLPATASSAGPARRAVASVVTEPELLDDARLLVSEAVANAVEHAEGGPVRLVVDVDPDTGQVVCAVRDCSPALTAAEPTAPGCAERESGRGLALVAALSRAWGFATDGTGKWLWFRLGPAPVDPAPAPAPCQVVAPSPTAGPSSPAAPSSTAVSSLVPAQPTRSSATRPGAARARAVRAGTAARTGATPRTGGEVILPGCPR